MSIKDVKDQKTLSEYVQKLIRLVNMQENN